MERVPISSKRAIQISLSALVLFTWIFDWGAELNDTHVWNPLWHPHARFHSMWQLATQFTIGIFVLIVTWNPNVDKRSLRTAIAVSSLESIGFVIGFLTLKSYDGDPIGAPQYDIRILGLPVNLLTYIGLIAAHCGLFFWSTKSKSLKHN